MRRGFRSRPTELGTVLETDPVVGYRVWVGLSLKSIWSRYYWPKDRPAHSICSCGLKLAYCQHGLYACWTIDQLEDYIEYAEGLGTGEPVIGEVAIWGLVAVHGEEGFRGEWGRVISYHKLDKEKV